MTRAGRDYKVEAEDKAVRLPRENPPLHDGHHGHDGGWRGWPGGGVARMVEWYVPLVLSSTSYNLHCCRTLTQLLHAVLTHVTAAGVGGGKSHLMVHTFKRSY